MQPLSINATSAQPVGNSALHTGTASAGSTPPEKDFMKLYELLWRPPPEPGSHFGLMGVYEDPELAARAEANYPAGEPNALAQWLQTLDPTQQQQMITLLPEPIQGRVSTPVQIGAALEDFLSRGMGNVELSGETDTPENLVATLSSYLESVSVPARAQPGQVSPITGTDETASSVAEALANLPPSLQESLQQWAAGGNLLPTSEKGASPGNPVNWSQFWDATAHRLSAGNGNSITTVGTESSGSGTTATGTLEQALRGLIGVASSPAATASADPAARVGIQPAPLSDRLRELLVQVRETLNTWSGKATGAESAFAQTPSPRAAATGAVTASIAESPGDEGWTRALAERVLWMAEHQVQKAQLRLNPPKLGSLEIHMEGRNNRTSVGFSAGHPFIREAIETALPQLREAIGEANLNLVNMNLV
jgi:hypothetical protein